VADVLLDTDVASVLQKGCAPAWVNRHHLAGSRVWLSFITVGELWKWAEARIWGQGDRVRLET
jgi:predicted nucleic acid-binding protein